MAEPPPGQIDQHQAAGHKKEPIAPSRSCATLSRPRFKASFTAKVLVCSRILQKRPPCAPPFLAALFAAAAPALAADTGAVNLGLDEVHTLTFRAPVATVYVGNPAIADITMIDARHAFVQGKSYRPHQYRGAEP